MDDNDGLRGMKGVTIEDCDDDDDGNKRRQGDGRSDRLDEDDEDEEKDRVMGFMMSDGDGQGGWCGGGRCRIWPNRHFLRPFYRLNRAVLARELRENKKKRARQYDQ